MYNINVSYIFSKGGGILHLMNILCINMYVYQFSVSPIEDMRNGAISETDEVIIKILLKKHNIENFSIES